ncbi:conserved hypothetical protein [Leishmania braziliensis MHOM/BR/75/M2904]|uniref:Uncharacterized protein n=2 Tax=Leishmania braziliensis TaxID=5660 RepID=A4HLD4_LEIBR|nr:conserved hypothetical protein [Leishmania braziliensis MHOM/BR/75/M2904]CAJ2479337.1 unnamed protein product [Leishmania braziliensis]CAM40628.1 conserved hypothetical protein [Leishmania braziliensis MHOM/BR/75/M2904]SYZ69020.1 hypothetical_protein [Leishmania braziliensis MHOM/BR/75/M2904]
MRTLLSAAGPRLTSDFEGAQEMFLHHIFDDAKEVALYSTTRRPEAFLRPEPAATGGAPEGGFQWQLMPLSAALKDMETVLQDMLRHEQQCCVKGESAGLSANSVVRFWRAMLEQAFLAQYCDLEALNYGDVAAPGAPQHWLHHIYPYDYSRQPAELRRRLERGIRALLCASAYTLHIHWEQHMARHPPSDDAAKILGLEFVMLWWWANPDQIPIELSLAATRLPPPTLQSLRQREFSAESPVLERHGDGKQPTPTPPQGVNISITPVSVEQHLKHYLALLSDSASTDARTHPQSEQQLQRQRRRRAVLRHGGLLCPAAMFPPAYQDALCAHLTRVHSRKKITTCPLFPRLVEVALAVATSSSAAPCADGGSSSSTPPSQRESLSAAARRGREIALQLCQEWLWPVICGRASPHAVPSTGQPLLRSGTTATHASPRTTSMETVKDWAVLIAAVAAVSQVRGNLLALRRASGANTRERSDRAHCAAISGAGCSGTEESLAVASERATSLARVRNHLYLPLMRALLIGPADVPSTDDERVLDVSGATAPTDMPGWVALVFACVAACFEEAGMLQHDIARQPATPARLWCLLFHSMCDTFPNVFHSGSTVTIMWTLLALEGVCAGPSLYYSTYRPTTTGKAQTMSAWLSTVAAWNGSEVLAAELLQLAGLPSCAEESKATTACTLCPRTERCQRTAFVISAAMVEALANDGGLRGSGVGASPTQLRHGRRHGRVTPLPSFASAPSPALPLQLSSPAELAQAQAYLTSCVELSEEVVTVSIEIFRRYATLPVLVPDVETLSSIEPIASAAHVGEERHGRSRGRPPTETALLRPQRHPSLMVLLRLLQVVAMFGEAGSPADADGSGLVNCVVDDVMGACHPVVDVHLRKLRAYAAAVSGRSGALALLHNETIRSALNDLSPSLGRQRLMKALLWSGLPAAAPEKGEEAEVAVYGSGSLAWYVLERNQQRFLAFTPPSASAAAFIDTTEDEHHKRQPSSTHDASETGNDAADDANSFAEVVSCLDEVLRHLWQLAIAIPDAGRIALCLYPCMDDGLMGRSGPDTSTSSSETVVNRSGEGASVPTNCGSDGVVDNESDSAPANSDEDALPTLHAAATGADRPDALTYKSVAVLESTADDFLEAEVEGVDTPADWNGSNLHVDVDCDDGVVTVMPAAYGAHAPLDTASLWDSCAAVRSSATRHAARRKDGVVTTTGIGEGLNANHQDSSEGAGECNTVTHLGDHRALAQTLLLATPAAQHIFYSLLDVLSWTVMPQASSADTTTGLALACPLGHAHLPGDRGRHWCERLAANYGKCVSVWEAHCTLTKESTTATPGAAALCRPQTMEHVALLLLQSCPDVYVVGLLLLAMAGGTEDPQRMSPSALEAFARRVQGAGSLLPWSVESSVAQLLFHAGVTAAGVQRWRGMHRSKVDSESRCGRGGAASTALVHVAVHRNLLQNVQRKVSTLRRCGGTSDLASNVKHDLLLSIGSLLLCSLEQRSAEGSRCRALYRYNAYVNEFLLHCMPGAEESGFAPSSPPTKGKSITALRVVLPSVQLSSPSPGSTPPQQMASLRLAWQRRMGRTEKAALRSSFRSRDLHVTPDMAEGTRSNTSLHTTKSELSEDDANHYVAAFA